MDFEYHDPSGRTEKDPHAQEKLYAEGTVDVWRDLAGNPHLDEYLQTLLARGTEIGVLQDLARNPCLTRKAQALLLERSNPLLVGKYDKLACEIDYALAGNVSLTAEGQDELVHNAREDVLETLADNSSLALHIQEAFLDDEDLVKRLVSNLGLAPSVQQKLWERSYGSFYNDTALDLVRNPACIPEILGEAVTSSHTDVRVSVSGNPNLTPEQMRSLVQDTEWRVRARLAQNNKLPADVLEALTRDEKPQVRVISATHPDLSNELVKNLSFDTTRNLIEFLEIRVGIVCTPEFHARFVRTKDYALYARTVGDVEAANGLVENWTGSLKDLAEAVALIKR